MVLYKKAFPLGAGTSFSGYIKALGKKKFPNYYLRIEKIPSTTNYHGTLVFTVPNWEWGLRGAFIDGVLLKDCTIEYSEAQKHFTIQASARTPNLILAGTIVLFGIALFILDLFMFTTQNSAAFQNITITTIVVVFMFIPPLWIYLHDKSFLDQVGFLGSHFQES
jgi:hypothetical protein